MFGKILIANRGEIAVRVMRTAKQLGIKTVAIHSAADAKALHVRTADEAVDLGPGPSSANYLNIGAIVAAAKATGAEAIHPGYGFLAENADFAQAIADAGLVFIGPSPAAIATMGEKVAARAVAVATDVPLAPGTGDAIPDAAAAIAFGREYGYPILIKAAFGGGGRGMRRVGEESEVEEAFASAVREATAAFGNGAVYVERFLDAARHVEVQVLGDAHGRVVALGDRDCSVQRRHQKLVEEAPAPGLTGEMRRAMADAAIRLAKHVDYTGVGTLEFLVEGDKFYFLEMNTRVQVEHPVTEAVTGVDIVAEQFRVAAGEPLSLPDGDLLPTSGAAVEARINAEAVEGGAFRPAPGPIHRLVVPVGEGLRWDGGYESGDTVSPDYDSLVGKLIAVGPDRKTAIDRLHAALGSLVVDGIPNTANAIGQIIDSADFRAMMISTNWLERSFTIQDEEPPLGRDEVEVVGRYYRIPYFSEHATTVTPSGPAAPEASAASVASRPSAGRRSKQEAFDGTIKSKMQGTIVKVGVTPGDGVTAGQQLFVLEAMKMENPIVAPADGTVAEVPVAVGQSVPPGAVLAVYQAA